MEVICIKKSNYCFVINREAPNKLIVGQHYFVIGEQLEPEGLFYQLAGFRPETGFHADLFVPVENHDEEIEQKIAIKEFIKELV